MPDNSGSIPRPPESGRRELSLLSSGLHECVHTDSHTKSLGFRVEGSVRELVAVIEQVEVRIIRM